jgi:hypothetical protein
MRNQVFFSYRAQLVDWARRLKWRTEQNQPPYDPNIVARRLKAEICERTLDGIEGYVVPAEPDSRYAWRVFIASSSVPERKRFTLAHELGHVLLMRGASAGEYPGLVRYRYTGRGISQLQDRAEEALCNAFAAEFLLPLQELRDQVSLAHIGPDSLVSIASKYQVSIHVTARRLAQLFGKDRISCSIWDLSTPWPVAKWNVGIALDPSEKQRLEQFVARVAVERVPLTEQWQKLGSSCAPFKIRAQVLRSTQSCLLLASPLIERTSRPIVTGLVPTQLSLW